MNINEVNFIAKKVSKRPCTSRYSGKRRVIFVGNSAESDFYGNTWEEALSILIDFYLPTLETTSSPSDDTAELCQPKPEELAGTTPA